MHFRKILIVLLILLNCALILRVVRFQRGISEGTAGTRGLNNYIPHFAGMDLNGQQWSGDLAISNRSHLLLVFFSLDDCASCLTETTLWNQAQQNGINIVGIARHIDEVELRKWVANARLGFPVIFDINGEITKLFQIEETPIKVLIDGHGKIVLVDGVRIGPGPTSDFIQLMKKMIPDWTPASK